MAAKHQRIDGNTEAITELSRRLDELMLAIRRPVQPVMGGAQVPSYSFVFGHQGEIQQEIVAAFDDDWIPIRGCDDFYTNNTGQTQTITVDIKNDTPRAVMDIDLGGPPIHTIPVGKTNTITVDVPAGAALHVGPGNAVGKYNNIRVK